MSRCAIELEELEKILDLVVPGDLATVTARIVSSGSTDFDFVRWVDKGTEQGVLVGQAVVDEDGLVGRVDFVTANSARVRLIIDPNSGVLVRNLATGEIGIVDGQGDRAPRLRIFNARFSVAEGQLVVTDGTRFPANLRVGVIIDAADSEAGFQLTTSIEPRVRFNQLDFVKVVVGYSPLDQGRPRGGRSDGSGCDWPSAVNARSIGLALLVLVTTVAIQTTALGPGSLQLFGASPNLVTLVVIGLARYLDEEPVILIGVYCRCIPGFRWVPRCWVYGRCRRR